jgi:hypothetical protein
MPASGDKGLRVARGLRVRAALGGGPAGLAVDGFGEAFDGVEALIPLPGDLGHRPGGLVESVGLYAIEHLAALRSPADQPRRFEHDQVLGDGLTAEGDVVRQPAGTGLTPLNEQIEHAATRRLGNRRPQVVVRLGRHALTPLRTLGEQVGESVQELTPAAAVLIGILLLLGVGPGQRAEAGLHDPQARALPVASKGELDQ